MVLYNFQVRYNFQIWSEDQHFYLNNYLCIKPDDAQNIGEIFVEIEYLMDGIMTNNGGK